MKIPFDLEKYNTGKYDVVTKLGHNIRLLCTDLNSNFPIAVAFMHERENEDEVLTFNSYGRFSMDYESEKDLMLLKRTITINTIKVPMPEYNPPIKGTKCFVPAITKASVIYDVLVWKNTARNKVLLERRLLHLDKESAITHAKALLNTKEIL